MIDDDSIFFDCPHCKSLLELDSTGDLILAERPELREGERKGVNGITVLESDPGWKQRDQAFNMQSPKDKATKTPFGFNHTLGATEPDPAIEQASKQDLKQRNIY